MSVFIVLKLNLKRSKIKFYKKKSKQSPNVFFYVNNIIIQEEESTDNKKKKERKYKRKKTTDFIHAEGVYAIVWIKGRSQTSPYLIKCLEIYYIIFIIPFMRAVSSKREITSPFTKLPHPPTYQHGSKICAE